MKISFVLNCQYVFNDSGNRKFFFFAISEYKNNFSMWRISESQEKCKFHAFIKILTFHDWEIPNFFIWEIAVTAEIVQLHKC